MHTYAYAYVWILRKIDHTSVYKSARFLRHLQTRLMLKF